MKLNKFIYHVSNPINRKSIQSKGIISKCGEQRYGAYSNNKPLVFATNSKSKLFNSCFDDDVWQIDSKFIKEFERDINYNGSNHIVIKHSVPAKAIKLIYVGTGKPTG